MEYSEPSTQTDPPKQKESPYDFAPWKPPFHYDEHGTRIVDSKDQIILNVRGWGFLTGQGALAMHPAKAASIQDALGDYVTRLLNTTSVGRGSNPVPASSEPKSATTPSLDTLQELGDHVSVLLGWETRNGAWKSPEGRFIKHPDYPNDLNAMHEAEKTLSEWQDRMYRSALRVATAGKEHRATATERAREFVAVMEASVPSSDAGSVISGNEKQPVHPLSKESAVALPSPVGEKGAESLDTGSRKKQ